LKKIAALRCLIACSLASGLLWGAAEAQNSADPRLDMVTAPKALGPHSSLGDQSKLWSRLIGTWHVEYSDFSKDGKRSHRSGEFIVGWVLDGRVIQDVWIVDPSGSRKEREVYTDLRYFDPKSQSWPAVFIDPEHASIARFSGGPVGDRIVLDTHDFEGTDTRWSINDLRSDSFIWREEESIDGGNTWRLTAEHHMKRRGAAPTSP
jgi:hypothetical protein